MIMEHYASLLKGFNNMAMVNHKIKHFNEKQISKLCGKCLFLCGTEDPLGNVEKIKLKLDKFNLEYQFYERVGHGINHEISSKINKRIIEYFTS